MKVIVKEVLREQRVFDMMPSDTILQLKQKVKEAFGIDIVHQRILLMGKTLADANPISFYPGIKEGTRLNLLDMKRVPGGSTASTPLHPKLGIQTFRNEVSRVLRHYYTESETETIVFEVIKGMLYNVNHFSYDDLERVATSLLQDQENIV